MGKKAARKRRSFSDEFKAETVRLVRDSGKSVGAVARELDLTETALRKWVEQPEIDAGRGATVEFPRFGGQVVAFGIKRRLADSARS